MDEEIGETIAIDDFRLSCQVKGTPSDLEGIVRKSEAIAMHDTKKDRDWLPIFMGIGIMFIMIAMAMIFLGKADLSFLAPAPAPSGDGGITAMIAGFTGVMI